MRLRSATLSMLAYPKETKNPISHRESNQTNISIVLPTAPNRRLTTLYPFNLRERSKVTFVWRLIYLVHRAFLLHLVSIFLLPSPPFLFVPLSLGPISCILPRLSLLSISWTYLMRCWYGEEVMVDGDSAKIQATKSSCSAVH